MVLNNLHGCSHSPPAAAPSRHPHALALMPAHTYCRTPQASTPPCVCSPFPFHVHQFHSLLPPSQHISVPPSLRTASPNPHLRHYRLRFAYSDTSGCPNALACPLALMHRVAPSPARSRALLEIYQAVSAPSLRPSLCAIPPHLLNAREEDNAQRRETTSSVRNSQAV